MSAKNAKYEGPYGEEFDEAYEKIEVVIEAIKDSLEDGFQLKDVVLWAPHTIEIFELAQEMFDEVTPEKITALTQYVYWAVDPDLPWVPDWIEDKVEKWAVIELALPLAVNAVWEAIKKKDEKDAEKAAEGDEEAPAEGE
jgi:hypothetical protein